MVNDSSEVVITKVTENIYVGITANASTYYPEYYGKIGTVLEIYNIEDRCFYKIAFETVGNIKTINKKYLRFIQ